jgi:3-deoxy-manno-octulosonate cytidylyltransferase (CMP-KDO synthetase)
MSTLAVIPARLGATRLPRKPLRLLGGEPLVVRVWERVQSLGIADHCVVATDSEEIATALRRTAAEYVLTSVGHPSGTDRVAEVASRPEYARFDTIVNVQGDEPFVSADAVRGAVSLVSGGSFPLATAAARTNPSVLDRADVVKVVTADDGRAMYFSRAGIPWLRDGAETSLRDRHVAQHIGIYAYAREALAQWVRLAPHPLELIERLEQLRPLAAGLAMGVAFVDEPPPGGIDTEDDLVRANARWMNHMAGEA